MGVFSALTNATILNRGWLVIVDSFSDLFAGYHACVTSFGLAGAPALSR